MASRDRFRYYVQSPNSSSGGTGRLDKVRLNHLLSSEGHVSGNEPSLSNLAVNTNIRPGSEEARVEGTASHPAQGLHTPVYLPAHGGPPSMSFSRSDGRNMPQGSSSRMSRGPAVVSHPGDIGATFNQGVLNRGSHPGYPTGDVHSHDATIPYPPNSLPDARYNLDNFNAGGGGPSTSSGSQAMPGIGHEHDPIVLVVFLGSPPYTINHVRKIPYGEVASLDVEQLLSFFVGTEL